LAIRVNYHAYSAGHCLPVNSSDECLLLRAGFTDANGIRFACITQHVCTNLYIVISGSKILTG
jgi:hypothetical protein